MNLEVVRVLLAGEWLRKTASDQEGLPTPVAALLIWLNIGGMLWRSSTWQAIKRACCFHSSLPANRRQAASTGRPTSAGPTRAMNFSIHDTACRHRLSASLLGLCSHAGSDRVVQPGTKFLACRGSHFRRWVRHMRSRDSHSRVLGNSHHRSTRDHHNTGWGYSNRHRNNIVQRRCRESLPETRSPSLSKRASSSYPPMLELKRVCPRSCSSRAYQMEKVFRSSI